MVRALGHAFKQVFCFLDGESKNNLELAISSKSFAILSSSFLEPFIVCMCIYMFVCVHVLSVRYFRDIYNFLVYSSPRLFFFLLCSISATGL